MICGNTVCHRKQPDPGYLWGIWRASQGGDNLTTLLRHQIGIPADPIQGRPPIQMPVDSKLEMNQVRKLMRILLNSIANSETERI
jgi:hypothetical protein